VRGRADALENLSVFYLANGDTLTASGLLSDAYDARPNPLYLGTAGSYFAHSGRLDLAEREFARLAEARPLDVEANLSLGALHAIRGDMRGAREYLLRAYGDTALVLPEPDVDSRADWEGMEKGPEREKFIRARVQKRQTSSKLFNEADQAARQGLLDAALRQYQRALRAYPRWGKMQYEVHSHVGTVYAMQGRYREAAYELLVAINYYDNQPLCYYIINAVGYGPARPSAVKPHARPSAD
jgi:tetratricopeptide (TPR) repeat protein